MATLIQRRVQAYLLDLETPAVAMFAQNHLADREQWLASFYGNAHTAVLPAAVARRGVEQGQEQTAVTPMADEPDDAVTYLGAIERLAQMPDIIRKVNDAVECLQTAGLNRRALVLLLHDTCRVSKKDINALLDALPTLADRFLTDGA